MLRSDACDSIGCAWLVQLYMQVNPIVESQCVKRDELIRHMGSAEILAGVQGGVRSAWPGVLRGAMLLLARNWNWTRAHAYVCAVVQAAAAAA